MGQKLYFDNYTAAGDILVIAICFVIGILVATSYNTRKEIPSGVLDGITRESIDSCLVKGRGEFGETLERRSLDVSL